jgi:hypothetical protein
VPGIPQQKVGEQAEHCTPFLTPLVSSTTLLDRLRVAVGQRPFPSEPEGPGGERRPPRSAKAARFSVGLDLLAPYLVDAESTIGSALDRVRAAGEHAKAETVVALLPAVIIDCDDRLETAGSRYSGFGLECPICPISLLGTLLSPQSALKTWKCLGTLTCPARHETDRGEIGTTALIAPSV